MKRTISATLLVLLAAYLMEAGAAFGQAGPALINYQGVLRDNNDKPLTGSYNIVFHFMSAATGGVEIMIDSHTSTGGNPVTVTGGLFNVALGGGTVTDGSGGGVYTSLSSVFKDYAAVHLKIAVNGEELSSRPRIVSAAYAMNADLVDGQHASGLLNTGSSAQTKTGPLVADASAASASRGVQGFGQEAGGFFSDSDNNSWGYVGYGGMGVFASGSSMGGWFANSGGNGYLVAGSGNTGLSTAGSDMAGYFEATGASGLTYIADGDQGIHAMGNEVGGYFQDRDNGSTALAAHGDYGIEAKGNLTGGYFVDSNSTGYAYVGYGDNGISAYGNTMAGYFDDLNGTGYSCLAFGNVGIWGYGSEHGGVFTNLADNSQAAVGTLGRGITATGPSAGGYFEDFNGSGYAFVGQADDGVIAAGNGCGGYFVDLNDSGNANVGYGTRGIWARGSFAGGTFSSLDNVTNWADVSKGSYKIVGTGAVSFVQNHPYDATRSIVYAAPEGDEAAVYTRGTARLAKGEARVPLGDTFRWVANPDIGLTAHLTPHGDCRGLYVASLTTEELVVREVGGGTSDVSFDFLVYGLRLGFEELAILQAKERDALPPTAEAIGKPYEGHEELRGSNALERYKAMRTAAGEAGEPDMTRSRALLAALEMQRAEAVARGLAEAPQPAAPPRDPSVLLTPDFSALPGGERPADPSAPGRGPEPRRMEEQETARGRRAADGSIPAGDGSGAVGVAAGAMVFTVSEPVEEGDLLAFDPDRPGELRRALSPSDSAVVGAAAAASTTVDGANRVPVAGNFMKVKADASFGMILPGDLLTSSATPGHAMKAPVPAVAGTIVGKAMERLDAGTGLLRILVLPR